MSKAGLIAMPSRGRFIASEDGRALLASRPDKIDIQLLMSRPAFREFYTREGQGSSEQNDAVALSTPSPDNVATPEERIEAASAELHASLREDLLERILLNSAAFFEELIVSLLVAMGYGGTHKSAARQLGRSGDGGVDGVIDEDRLGLDRVYVQAKRYALEHAIGRPDVQGFVGSLVGLGATKGVFVTTSSFSSHARDFVRHLGQRIVLIDGLMLADLMIEHGVGVRLTQSIAIKRLDEDFFAVE